MERGLAHADEGTSLTGAVTNALRLLAQVREWDVDLPATGEVVLDLYDVTGRRVATSGPQVLASGSHVLSLGKSLVPGVYHAQLRFGDQMLQTRVVIIR